VVTQAALPYLRAQGSGQIIPVSSIEITHHKDHRLDAFRRADRTDRSARAVP